MHGDFFEDESLGRGYDLRLVKRFLQFIAPYWFLILITFSLIGITTLLELTIPLILKEAVDGLQTDAEAGHLIIWAAMLLGIVLIQSLVAVFRSYLTSRTGQSVIRDLRVKLFRHLLRLPIRFFDRNPTGRLLVRVTNDIENLNELFASGIVQLFADIVTLVGILIMMLHLSPELTLGAFGAAPLIGIILLTFRILARRMYREIRRKIAKVNAYLAECIQGMRVIKMFSRESTCQDKFEDLNEDLCQETVRNARLHSIMQPFMEIIGAFMIAFILWYGGLRIFEGAITFGTFLAFWYCVRRLMEPLRDLSDKYNILQSAMASSERIFKILDSDPESTLVPTGPREHTPGAIEFRNVTFSYDGKHPVLQNVSFKVPPGGHIALVGATGSGKTTLVNLLLGFYRIEDGDILLDGKSVRHYDPRDLRRRFGIVGQDVFLFSGTVQENIRLGDEDIPVERVRRAAESVNLDHIIERLPGGYRTDVRERGLALSAGERQLISLARAFCVDSSVLLLDEATSYVDMETDHLVHEATARLLKGRTAIIVAHRLATVRNMDRILVMHRGRIEEEGAHSDLLKKKGIYERLCRIQFEAAFRS
jgi:ATP-binding cassette subfamily B protein